MRFVVLGTGAIGGVVGIRLRESGHDVMLVARGAHREAIATSGLVLETPSGRSIHRLPVVAGPAEAELGEGDIVLVCVKSQDTEAALVAVRDAYAPGVPVVMLQNGVENERVALRLVPRVYGAVVFVPAAHLEPGVVQSFAIGLTGKLDIGRYPGGVDATAEAVCAALSASNFESLPNPEIMDAKYQKLVENLANAPQAICGLGAEGLGELVEAARREGRAVLDAAHLSYLPRERRHRVDAFVYDGVGEIAGRPRAGGSTWQSLARGTPLESDYLTGEIVLQARLIGADAPLNTHILSLVRRTAVEGLAPGWMTPAEVLAGSAVA